MLVKERSYPNILFNNVLLPALVLPNIAIEKSILLFFITGASNLEKKFFNSANPNRFDWERKSRTNEENS